MTSPPAQPISGHVYRGDGKRGGVWYATASSTAARCSARSVPLGPAAAGPLAGA